MRNYSAKTYKNNRTFVNWHRTAPCQHSGVNKSIASYLEHWFINCCGAPHVCQACAGACRGTIMFKIVCLKITAMWPRTESINCSKYFSINQFKKFLRIRTLVIAKIDKLSMTWSCCCIWAVHKITDFRFQKEFPATYIASINVFYIEFRSIWGHHISIVVDQKIFAVATGWQATLTI